MKRQRKVWWKGLLAGLAGGAVASWTMNEFQSAIAKVGNGSSADRVPEQKPGGRQLYDAVAEMHSRPAGRQQQRAYATDPEAKQSESNDDATTKAAQKLANITGHQLEPGEKKRAGQAVHYVFGSAVGAGYGLASEFFPPLRTAAGAPFGAAVWLLADEIGVPALKLSKPPTSYGFDVHAKALAAHLVYGATAELVRRSTRALI